MILEQVMKHQAEVGAVCHCLRAGGRKVVIVSEAKSTIIGLLAAGEQTFAATCLNLEPGICA